jgi:hypothetical protein
MIELVRSSLSQQHILSERICCSAVPLRQLARVHVRKYLLANRLRPAADDLHLRKRRRREEWLKDPEHPRHDRGYVDEELAVRREELGVVRAEDARSFRGRVLRVLVTTAEADALVVCVEVSGVLHWSVGWILPWTWIIWSTFSKSRS